MFRKNPLDSSLTMKSSVVHNLLRGLLFNLSLHAGLACTALAAELPVIREVVVTSAGKGAKVEIRADKPLKFTSYFMPELTKWVIDLPNSVPAFAEESRKVATVPLERVTVREREINGVPFSRIGLDVSGEVAFSAATDLLDKGQLTVYLDPVLTDPVTRKQPAFADETQKDGDLFPADEAPAKKRNLPAKNVTAIIVSAEVVKLEADGNLTGYRSFTLKKPGRLVFDFDALGCIVEEVKVSENRFGIVRGRVGKYNGKLRIVFEAGSDSFPAFLVKKQMQGVEIAPAPP